MVFNDINNKTIATAIAITIIAAAVITTTAIIILLLILRTLHETM